MTQSHQTALQPRQRDAARIQSSELIKQRQDHWNRLEAALNRYVTGMVRKDMNK